MTITTDAPAVAGFAADYAHFGAWLDEHPGIADLLSHIHSVPLRSRTPAGRKAELEAIAARMGAEVEWRGAGYRSAFVRFGRVVVEAHRSPSGFIPAQSEADAA